MKIKIYCYGEGYPLVLFHGWGFDSGVWQSITPALIDAGYQLYLVDLPGFGNTSLCDWGYFKTELLSALPPRFALIGWSMGGLFATRLAAEASERITHLLNVSSSPKFVKENGWPGIEMELFHNFYRSLRQNPLKTLEEFVSLQSHGENKKSIRALISNPIPEGLSMGLDCLLRWDLRLALNHLAIPVCYLFGRLDAITPHATKLAMEKTHPHLVYRTFKQSAHMPFMSQQNEFIALLKEFIS
ncbi:alpha/beta fold hydrolase [Legionella impletisoli]|uniref:Pimeloyl-[acyl-carrier protein] methyl ester esterase n=1 Tax=Legionella impletisoli TaxID=343510 RepID=A0A917N9S0_9GAMM|nr:alpha/beta fold hydrolase [Legionella impletisoli]GGI81396.1 pimeloyl-[acyl-carrier protein] methyl ester esterase [Legionella impletisoli]